MTGSEFRGTRSILEVDWKLIRGTRSKLEVLRVDQWQRERETRSTIVLEFTGSELEVLEVS